MGRRILVTGASGYIGGRLVPELVAAGHEVRCLARTPAKLADRPWVDEVEVVEGDVLDPDSLDAAMTGVDAAYYLVHSMDGEGDFRDRDRRAARTFRDAAARAGVSRIVYLGGLGREEGGRLSPHLASRHEVGRVLADGPVPVTELRAAIIIGSGSASFEMLRNLVDVLPVMITPRWVSTRCQPIAIRDVLHYLVAALDHDELADRIVEVGGSDVLTYREMMQVFAEEAGLGRRVILPVPVLTPRLSSLWVGLVTPLPAGLARPLVESLGNEVVVVDDAAQRVYAHEPMSFREAVRLALRRVQDLDVATTWSDARRPVRDVRAEPAPEDPAWAGGTVFTDERTATSTAPPDLLFDTVRDLAHRHPRTAIEDTDPPRHLRLRVTLRAPGEAWLEYRVRQSGDGSRLEQRARFHPRGLWGRVYWLGTRPAHRVLLPRLVHRIARGAEADALRLGALAPES